MKRADLAPPLGKPGGPCHVVRRVVDETDDPLESRLREKVEDGADLSNPEAARVYDRIQERVKGIANRLTLLPHAQYRMDLRGVTVRDLKDAVMEFGKWMSALKKQGDRRYDAIARKIERSEPVKYTSPQGLTIVIDFEGKGQADLITTYWRGEDTPKATGECRLVRRVARRWLSGSRRRTT